MSKTKPFSIYLLKKEFDHTNAMKEGHALEEEIATELPDGAHLYVLDTPARPPWWRAFFGIERELFQATKGALIFLAIGDRNFAISFGHVYHHLNDYSLEYDFGLRVTLNSLDPRELKSADMVSPGTARRKRTQVAISTDITFLDFDGNSEIIRSLTGKIKDEYKEIFKNATGSTSLKVGMKVEPQNLPSVCKTLLELHKSDAFKETFPNIQNISPVRDPARTDELNLILLEAFKNRSDAIALSIPEVVDYHGDKTCCFFRAEGKTSEIFPDITIDALWNFLGEFDISPKDATSLREYQLVLCDVEGNPGRAYTVMRSLVYETGAPEDAAIFHLTDGNWYRAEASFVTRMTEYINARCRPCHLPPYNHDQNVNGKNVYSEEAYNAAITAWDENYICLDQTDMSPASASQVEPCDIYSISDLGTEMATADMYHVKISTRSAHLSHLFNQGLNSVELLKQEDECSENLKSIIGRKVPEDRHADLFAPIDQKKFTVYFGIITQKDAATGGGNLPLFSRLSLMRTMQILEMYTIQCALLFIDDQSPKKSGHKKYHEIDVVISKNEGGKVRVRPCPGQDGFDPEQDITHCPKEIRDALPGTQFRLQVNLKEGGVIKSHHNWDYEVIDGGDQTE